MRKSVAFFVLLVAVSFASAFAIETPRIIPRSERVEHPIDQVYGTLKQYFTDSSLSGFVLNNADKKGWTLIATRSDIDDANWKKWTFCKAASAEQMISKLEDATVTVTVQLQKDGASATFVVVSADFQASYILGVSESKIACASQGTLEQDLIAVAGGPSAGSH